MIAPSILSADLAHLQEEVSSIEPYADWLQIDVMDGHFVPSISFGAPIVRCIQTALPLDIHLMVSNPAERIDEFLEIGAANITFHAEAVAHTEHRKELIQRIRAGGATAGIAINPETSLDSVGDVLEEIDLLLVMSVHPGFGGQPFIEHVLSNVRTARSAFPDLMIQMDGGINKDTASECVKAGANNLVSGSFIFGASDRKMAINSLRQS
ncbi:MAG: ribulose-phosphate 3-epimerase [Candidatus Peregrinibacteria bacterium]|nr:ribulose-phosphate 3-epimerase [Candidatus Peregrinibacteria bacterium]MCB9807702.1 ribulose-phosphate 3-epimerase [Candidatus Peribacteria bacterium]